MIELLLEFSGVILIAAILGVVVLGLVALGFVMTLAIKIIRKLNRFLRWLP